MIYNSGGIPCLVQLLVSQVYTTCTFPSVGFCTYYSSSHSSSLFVVVATHTTTEDAYTYSS